MSGHTVVVRKRIPVSREEVYDAWLDPQGMSRWMCPGPVTGSEVTMDPRVGGRFRILMKAGAESFDHTGEFVTLERPSRLQFTWHSKGTGGEQTLVTIDLTPAGGECDLVLTHERFPTEKAAAQHQDGWTQIADKLANYATTRAMDSHA